MIEKLLSHHVGNYFSKPLPEPNPEDINGRLRNLRWCQHQMLFILDHHVRGIVKRMDILMPEIQDYAVEEARENIRKVSLMLEYSMKNYLRWEEQNIDFSELCAYIDIELLKAYPDEQHTIETLPA
jgi:hypothetical protein